MTRKGIMSGLIIARFLPFGILHFLVENVWPFFKKAAFCKIPNGKKHDPSHVDERMASPY